MRKTDGDLPADLRLLTVAARLLDLHGTRRDSGEDPAFHLWLGLRLVEALHRRELKGGPARVPLAALLEPLAAEHPRVRLEDLEFCAGFLALDRELRYLAPDAEGRPVERSTRATTPLVKFHRRYGEVTLTENGRLLMRIGGLHRDWLFEDKDVERIVAAIERSLFEDVPRLCHEAVASLRALNEHLTEIEESPTFEALRGAFEERRDQYREMLRCCEHAVRRAISLLGDAAVRRRFEMWKSLSAEREDEDLSDLLIHVETVLQALESLSRHWVKFLTLLQARRRRPLGVVDFAALAERLMHEAPPEHVLRTLVQSMGPWRHDIRLFGAQAFAGAVDFRRRVREPARLEFDLDHPGSTERFRSFLERNAAVLLESLRRRGRLPLSTLLTEGRFTLGPDGDIAELFGVFTLTDELGEDVRVAVGLGPDRFRHDLGDCLVHGDDPVLWLMEEKNDAS